MNMVLKGLDEHYLSMLAKIKTFVRGCKKKGIWSNPAKLWNSFTTIELNIFRFHMMIQEKHSEIIWKTGFPKDWDGTSHFDKMGWKLDDEFISSYRYNIPYYHYKLNRKYFSFLMRLGKDFPLFDPNAEPQNDISCLEPEDEVYYWRNFPDKMRINYDRHLPDCYK